MQRSSISLHDGTTLTPEVSVGRGVGRFQVERHGLFWKVSYLGLFMVAICNVSHGGLFQTTSRILLLRAVASCCQLSVPTTFCCEMLPLRDIPIPRPPPHPPPPRKYRRATATSPSSPFREWTMDSLVNFGNVHLPAADDTAQNRLSLTSYRRTCHYESISPAVM